MQRMQREQGSDKRATHRSVGELREHKEKKNGIGQMEGQADQVLRPRVRPKDLAVQHVREPGERMPITGVTAGKCPRNIFQIQAAQDVRIGSDIIRIIVINEIVPTHRQVNGEGKECEQQRDENWPGGCFHELSKMRKECRQAAEGFARFKKVWKKVNRVE